MHDKILKLHNSTMQHGKMNDRIYLMDFNSKDINFIIEDLDNLSQENSYSKIIAKVPSDYENVFINNGYVKEAYIPKFYKGIVDCSFVSKYNEPNRAKTNDKDKIDNVLRVAQSKSGDAKFSELPSNIRLRQLNREDIDKIIEIYKIVFETYPFPIHNPTYIEKTMLENVVYYGIFDHNKLFALSSSELSLDNLNAEMTDFAILPEYRGNNYALNLLKAMEEDLINNGYKTLYTIARAISYGMNSTFAKLNYSYSGTLINNTNISGDIESMNVWYKNL